MGNKPTDIQITACKYCRRKKIYTSVPLHLLVKRLGPLTLLRKSTINNTTC